MTSLVFDETLELCDIDGRVTDSSFWFETLGEGASFGEAVPIEVAINSLLLDGAIVDKQGDGNAEHGFLITVKSSDSRGLAEGVAALHRATGKRTTLTWTPPDDYAPVTVFDIETSNLTQPNGFEDLAFVRNEMTVRLRIIRLPFARSSQLTTEVAEGIPSIGTTVNDGESTTGFSTPAATAEGVVVDPQPTMVAVDSVIFSDGTGSLKATAFGVDAGRYVGFLPTGDARLTRNKLTLTQGITTTAGTYFSFSVRIENDFTTRTASGGVYGDTYQVYGALDLFAITSVEKGRQEWKKVRDAAGDRNLSEALVQALPNGFTRYTFLLPDALSITSVEWTSTQLVPYTTAATDAYRPHIWIDQVAKSESATLGKQVLKSVEVGGSARTSGAIHVAAPADNVALGQVVAYTVAAEAVPLGFRPDLAQWVQPGATTTADADATDGIVFTVGSTFVSSGTPILLAPARLFTGQANTLMARLKTGVGNFTFDVEVALFIDDEMVGTATEIAYAGESDTTGFHFVSLGTPVLPPMLVSRPTDTTKVRFRFRSSGSAGLDDLYAFPVQGDLSVVDCGLGTVGPNASSHLWIDSPDTTQARGGYWRGATPTRADSLSAWANTIVPGIHSFVAGSNLAFVACTGAAGPTVSFDFYKRWMFNAAED